MRPMRTSLAAFAALAALVAAPASAQAQVELTTTFRILLPAAPPLVVIQPGVQVVQDHDDEVFVHGGTYWSRRGDRWYRSRGPQAAFVLVDTRLVPEPVRRLPPGNYRRYRPPPPRVEAHRLDKKEEKRLRKEQDEARKAHEREHGHDHDHGKGH